VEEQGNREIIVDPAAAGPAARPSKAATVALSCIALYPLIVLANAFLVPHIQLWPLWLRSAPIPLLAPPVLSYVAVPTLLRAARVLNICRRAQAAGDP
jgi:antibiotic biosynthesis monooxygenase (ABM) superfamily enzyme